MADLSNVTPSLKNVWSLVPALALALGGIGCSGLEAGIDYPETPDIEHFLRTPENQTGPAIAFNSFKVTSEACPNIDTHPITQKLAQDELTKFFEAQGIRVPARKARSNLYWFDVPNGERGGKGFVRLRLAVLDSQPLASADLHQSLLEHGPGWWGVRRSNLAVLAPRTSLREAMSFAIKYKLVCWGMFTYAGVDDAYVVPGPYGEM